MQAIWKGTISFGLVSIPVKVFSATEQRDIIFRQVHQEDGGRIRYRRVCDLDGKEVPYSDIGKGYELPDGRIVVLDDDDLANLPLPTAKTVEVLEFVPLEQVDPLYFARAYYLSADGVGAKPYVLLRDALSKAGLCALVKVAIRTRESLALLRERDGALVLQTMFWDDEVRNPQEVAPAEDVTVRKQEVDMAQSYIAAITGDFDPTRYHNEYREALEAVVEAKVSGLPMPEPAEEEGATAEVVDLVAALRASVAAARERRGGAAEEPSGAGGSERGKSPKRKPGAASKRSAAKSSASKRTATKSSSTKRAATKKPTRKSA
ncbi:MAG TPA: Ku protein [Nocardioidaceae bacterium]|nr:Ku protein [Nocardioidaceae bacterium]